MTFNPASLVESPSRSQRGGSMAGSLDSFWQSFNERAIPRLVSQGNTIYVDVTADWCITCFVNKSVLLSNRNVRNLLSNGRVIAMKADWTKPSKTISRFLARYNRYGIPFNIIYGPNRPEGLVLPELLTPSVVLNSFGLVLMVSNFVTPLILHFFNILLKFLLRFGKFK